MSQTLRLHHQTRNCGTHDEKLWNTQRAVQEHARVVLEMCGARRFLLGFTAFFARNTEYTRNYGSHDGKLWNTSIDSDKTCAQRILPDFLVFFGESMLFGKEQVKGTTLLLDEQKSECTPAFSRAMPHHAYDIPRTRQICV